VLADQIPPGQGSKRERKIFSTMDSRLSGPTVALIFAESRADAEYYALHELGFVRVDSTTLASDFVHVMPADTEEIHPS
jgi:hypothetical protein